MRNDHGNLAKIGRQASDYYACALLEFMEFGKDFREVSFEELASDCSSVLV